VSRVQMDYPFSRCELSCDRQTSSKTHPIQVSRPLHCSRKVKPSLPTLCRVGNMQSFLPAAGTFVRRARFKANVVVAILGCFGGGELFAQSAQRFTLNSNEGKFSYVVDVWLPRGYLADPRPFPMLLMLDGEYAFSSAVQLSEYLQRNRDVLEFLVVGVSYGVGFGKPLAAERTRDFTPPVDHEGAIKKTETAYYRFIKDRLLPELHQRYQIHPTERALWGYSLSGSFAAWLNYYDPTLFDHYVLASANLMDSGMLQRLFQRQIFSGTEPGGRRVFISYDTTEIPDPKIVEEGRKLLSSKEAFPGYEIRLFLTQGESHASSWFVSLPTTLRFIFARASDAGSNKRIDSAAPAGAAPENHASPVTSRKE
jgi:uncharacterized protein